MTIDEITTALQEWRGDDEEKHYLLIAIEGDESITTAVLGTDFILGCALASTMRAKKQTENIVRWAMALKDTVFFNDQDNDQAETDNN